MDGKGSAGAVARDDEGIRAVLERRLRAFWDDNAKKGSYGTVKTQRTLETENEVEFTALVSGSRGTATGTARIDKKTKDPVETCELSAISNALWNQGYGFGEKAPEPPKQEPKPEERFVIRDPDSPVTDAQLRLIAIRRRTSAENEAEVADFLAKRSKKDAGSLTKGEANELINLLKDERGV
jgi:hypothetical protein